MFNISKYYLNWKLFHNTKLSFLSKESLQDTMQLFYRSMMEHTIFKKRKFGNFTKFNQRNLIFIKNHWSPRNFIILYCRWSHFTWASETFSFPQISKASSYWRTRSFHRPLPFVKILGFEGPKKTGWSVEIVFSCFLKGICWKWFRRKVKCLKFGFLIRQITNKSKFLSISIIVAYICLF